MNNKALKSAWMLTLAGALALSACSGDGDIDTDTGPGGGDAGMIGNDGSVDNDAGPQADGGPQADSGPQADGGPNGDGGRPEGPRPMVCPTGTEGCGCTSTRPPDGATLLQDDCEADLLCADWDNISGQTDLTGAFQSCVKPCTVDADCGAGRSCRPSGFNAESGAENICVDRVAGFDEFCGFSKLATSVDPDPGVEVQTGGELVGCGPEADCLLNLFGDVHVSEGICLRLCSDDTECSGPTPLCNTQRFTSTSTVPGEEFIGVCQEKLFERGQLCGSADPAKVGVTGSCNTNPDAVAQNTVCVGLGGLFDEGLGTCLTQCDANQPCPAARPGRPDEQCITGFFTDGSGVCNENCSLFGETCPATGGEAGLGFTCFEVHRLFDLQGDEVSQCMERLAPALTNIATLDAASGMITDLGDNCWATGGSNNYLRCPYPSWCEVVDFQNGAGACLTGCALGAPGNGEPTCEDITGAATSSCTAVFMNNTEDGLCGNL